LLSEKQVFFTSKHDDAPMSAPLGQHVTAEAGWVFMNRKKKRETDKKKRILLIFIS
jgi:hypothetical protein